MLNTAWGIIALLMTVLRKVVVLHFVAWQCFDYTTCGAGCRHATAPNSQYYNSTVFFMFRGLRCHESL